MNLLKKLKLNSINKKTIVYLVLYALTILLFLWLTQIVFLDKFYEEYKINSINNAISTIKKSEDVNTTLETVAYKYNVCIEHTDLVNTKTYNIKLNGCLLNTKYLNTYKLEMSRSNNEIDIYKLVNPEYETRAILYGLKYNNTYIYIFSNLEDIDGASFIMKNQLLFIFIFMLVFSIIIALFVSRRITKPIRLVTDKTKKIITDNYELDIPKTDIKEIDELITTLEYVSSEFKSIDEYRRDIMANVSHDLKTPLTMIKAYAETIRDISYKNKDKMNEHLDIIVEETDRLNVLVEDILSLSKIQNNINELTIEEYDIITEVNNIIKKYDIIQELESYKFILKCPKQCMVKADKNKLNQVIYNLINNAINYTGKDKTIMINIIDNKNTILFEVIDTGKGIDKKDLPNIWNKYYKNDKNHQRNVVGTGLGLTIVKTILDKHSYKYGVDSKKNKGTKFYFEITK